MRSSYYIFAFITILSVLSGCSPRKYLKENEYLLYKQSIKGNKKMPSEFLTALYQQETNRRVLGFLSRPNNKKTLGFIPDLSFMPYVSIYNIGKAKFDTTKVINEIKVVRTKYDTLIAHQTDSLKIEKLIHKKEKKLEKLNTKLKEGNWLMRGPGEAPTIYDSSLVNETVKRMQHYLFSKGFFKSTATLETDTSGKKIRVKYKINEGNPYNLNEINYDIADPKIKEIIDNNLKESLLKVNERYDEANISAERDRLNKLLKNNGYYEFTRQFIFFEVDTTKEHEKVTIYIVIKNPPDGKLHQQYTINKIIFNTDVTNIEGKERDTILYNGIYYAYYNKRFSKKILGYKVKISPKSLYSQKNIQESQIQLASLDMYKFININFEKDRTDTVPNSLTAHIRTSPYKKFQITDEFGVNVGQGFIPGPFGSITFKDRNVFGGFEIFEASIRYSIDGQASLSNPDQPLTTQQYGGNLSLTFPQIFFPILGKKANDYSPKTSILTGYTFINRPEYIRANLKTALYYNWQTSKNKQYNIALLDMNIVQTPFLRKDFEDRLDTLLKQGNNLKVSFNNSIVTSFNAYYIYNNNDFSVLKKSKYFKPYFEIGGNIVNALSKYISKEPGNKFLGLQYFEFVKFSNDLRFYFPANKKSIFAMRFNGGFVTPYGSSSSGSLFVLPYEKYFFSGGSNSIRAWKPRRLGPGSYKDPSNNYLYEQPGHILIETSFEFRHNIISFVKGAVFVDAGNVWTIKNEPTRPGSQFKLNSFLSQMAVGAGYGLRFDFTFLILRLDLGIKMWDPGENGSERLLLKHLIKNPPFGRKEQSVINIGIGYPF